MNAARRGETISLSGHDWEPMQLGPATSSREPGKGSLHPADSVLVVIDMQPLFYDALSPWGVPATPECTSGGLPCSRMNDLWPRQLRLAHAFAEWTGTYGSSLGSRGFRGSARPRDAPKALDPGLAPLLPPRGAAMGLRP